MRINPMECGLWLLIIGIPCSRALTELGATLIILAWFWQKCQAGEFTLRRSVLLGPVMALFAWSAASILWTPSWPLSLRALIGITAEYTALYLALSDGLRDGRMARRVIWLWAIWSGVIVLNGGLQLVRGADLIHGYAPGLIAGGARMTSSMKYPNDYAAYAAMSGLLAIGLTIAEWSQRRRGLALAALVMVLANLTALVMTFSRGAWIGFAVAGLVALMVYRTRYAVLLIVAAGVIVTFLPAPYFERMAGMLDVHPGSSTDERLLVWHSALRMIQTHPWIGFGLNTYNVTFPEFKDPKIWGTPYAHNCFLQLTCELGAIGLGLFLWLLIRIFKQGWRPAQRPGWERSVSLGLLAGTAGFVIHSSADTNWYALPLATMWWLAVGLIDGLNGLAEDRQLLFTKQIQRLVAIRTDRLGDVLMNLPALQALRRRFPTARLSVAVKPDLVELLEGQPGIHQVAGVRPDDTRGWLGLWRWAMALRRGRYDAAVILNPTRQAHLATFLAGIPIRVGYARKWDFLLTDTLPDHKTDGLQHEVDYNLELVGQLGASTPHRAPHLVVPAADREIAQRLLQDAGLEPQRPIVALHPWTSDPVKQWPLSSVAELIDHLLLAKTMQLLLIGGPEEQEGARHFAAGLRAPIASMVGQLSLRQLAAVLTHCQVLVSNDSGPVHVAAAVGTPTVTLFTGGRQAATPKRWGPLGTGHILLTSRHPEMPIAVDEVLAAVQRQLERVKTPAP